MRTLFCLLLFCLHSLATPPSGYTLAFSGKFNTYEYAPIQIGWNQLPVYVLNQAYTPEFLGHTSTGQDFGDAYFTTPNDPTGNPSPWWDGWGQMVCSPYIDGTGHWRSGIVSTADTIGDGFSASLGYWECSFTVPNQPGIWPSFWLNDLDLIPYLGQQNNGNHYEIDVCELYGYNPVAVNQHLHIWAPNGGGQVGGADNIYQAPNGWAGTTTGSFQEGSHVYGVLITTTAITFYMDGVQTFQCAAPAGIASHKFYGMIDYALGAGYPDPTPPCNPMWIQEFNYYAPPN